MRKLKVWLFKENGTFYAEEEIEIPDNLTGIDEIHGWIMDNYKAYMDKHVVIPFTEKFLGGYGYPCMIPAHSRS